MAKYPGFIGPSARVRSINVNAERTINWYLEHVGGTPKVQAWLAPTPGLEPFVVVADAPVRALFAMDGRAFAVVGTGFYEIFANHTTTLHGLVNANAFPATISSNGTNGHQLLITSAGNCFIFDLVADTFVLLPDDGIGGPTRPTRMATFSDGYFIALRANSNEFQISALYDGTDWDALDVFQVSTVADQVQALVESHRDLWVFGTQTTSVWSNTGDADTPYQPISGVKIEQGCGAAFSAIPFDNAIMWLGSGVSGDRIVWRANGYTPERVSTHAVEFALGQARRIDDAIAWSYQQEGHTFYVLYVPDLADVRGFATTWVYDAATREWHERALWDTVLLDWQPHLGRCHTYAFGAHLVGDRSSGAIYDLRLGLSSDTVVVSTTGAAPVPEPDPTAYTLDTSSSSYAITGSPVTDPGVLGAESGSYAVTGSAAESPELGLVLTEDDFTYLGMFSVGADFTYSLGLVRQGYSYGALTGRKVAGQVRLFVTGSAADEWRSPLYEITPPAEASWTTSKVTAPSATFLADWSAGDRDGSGNIYPNGQPVYDTNGSMVKGLIYDPVLNGVWYSYLALYNTGPTHDPSIGFIALDDDADTAVGYGPWRHEAHSPATGSYGLYLPAAVADVYTAGRNLCFGAETATRGVWGPSLFASARLSDWATRPPDATADVPATINGPSGAQPRWSIPAEALVYFGSGSQMMRAVNYNACGWTVQGVEGGYTEGPGDTWGPTLPYPEGTARTDMASIDFLDTFTGAIYIPGSKTGVIFFGAFTWPTEAVPTPHTWYGPAHCPHGQTAPWRTDTPGYGSGSLKPFWYVYDPVELFRVYSGEIAPSAPVEDSHFVATDLFGAAATYFDTVPNRFITGAWFDEDTRYLYLAEFNGDYRYNSEPRTMIHVFEVAG